MPMSAQYETLLVGEPHPHVVCVTLNRPASANALNTRMAEELAAVFAGFSQSQSHRCIVITGAGERAFCAGADLKERDGMSNAQWQAQHKVFELAFLALMECPLPLIAAVNGAAFGGGCEMVLACDFAYASRSVRFALPETSLGIMPGGGGTRNLPRVVGLARAKEIILSAAPFSAEDAERWGLINRICEPAKLMEDVLAVTTKIAANAPLALRQAKKALGAAIGPDRHAGTRVEIEAYDRLVPTADRSEGIRAFNEKRRPRFTGR